MKIVKSIINYVSHVNLILRSKRSIVKGVALSFVIMTNKNVGKNAVFVVKSVVNRVSWSIVVIKIILNGVGGAVLI